MKNVIHLELRLAKWVNAADVHPTKIAPISPQIIVAFKENVNCVTVFILVVHSLRPQNASREFVFRVLITRIAGLRLIRTTAKMALAHNVSPTLNVRTHHISRNAQKQTVKTIQIVY